MSSKANPRASHFNSKPVLIMLVLSVITAIFLMKPEAAAADSITIDPQTRALMEAVEKGVEAWLTDGNSTRGASGYLGALISDAPTLACAAWIMSFRDTYLKLINDDAPDTILQKMNTLREKVNSACDRVISPIESEDPPIPEESENPVRNDCPDCPKSKRWARETKYDFDLVQYYLNRAKDETDHWKKATQEKQKTARADAWAKRAFKDSEEIEATLRADLYRKKEIMERAHQSFIKCLESCLAAAKCEIDYKCSKCGGGLSGAFKKAACEVEQSSAVSACKNGEQYEATYECE